MSLLSMLFGWGGESAVKISTDWTKTNKIAGKEQKLSHVSGLAADEKFIYVTSGGTIADQNEKMSGLRKIALDSGAVTVLDDGSVDLPQSEDGGIVTDEKYVYWNAGGKIRRVAKEGGPSEAIASENVGIGIDLAIDDQKLYWTNHKYYSPYKPTLPSPIYAVSIKGGKTEIFADRQNIPGSILTDEKYVYWHTTAAILKQAKTGGAPQIVFQVSEKENLDQMTQDGENLYFGFRSAGSGYWSLRKVSKQGGEAQTLAKTYSLKPVAVDAANVYFFEEARRGQDAFCKISKNGGEITRLDQGYAGGIIAQNKSSVFFAGMDDVYRVTK